MKKSISVWAGDGLNLNYRFKRQDGTWRDFETVATNLLKTQPVGALVLNSRDMTEYHRTASALEKERALVEQQRTFISMLSHEFRTPLTIIDGNAQILDRRGKTLEQDTLKMRARTIRSAVERLIGLIDTILSANAIETGKLVLNPAPCNLAALIIGVCDEQEDISPRHKIEVKTESLKKDLYLDQKIVRHIVSNLVSNAVKYSSDNPDILVSAEMEEENVRIRVRDRGVGIPEKDMPRMFQKYFRASTSAGIPGSGVGLSLVKHFIDLHNGRIDLQSKVGEGTEITVWLPVKE
jgi:signal transduction histidine kinase